MTTEAADCRLLVRAVRSSSGQRARHIAHAVSDAFVVATQRVKQAQKSSIPHMEEHVSKLDFVGVQTQLKLQDIKGAAAASGVVGLSVIHNNITTGQSCHVLRDETGCSQRMPRHSSKLIFKHAERQHVALSMRCTAASRSYLPMHSVGHLWSLCSRLHDAFTRGLLVHSLCCACAVGQFKELVESSERDVQLQETLRKVLNFTAKGWEAARQHALRAVGTDNRMRIWCADDSMDAGLLFRCSLGRVDLHAPVGEPTLIFLDMRRSHLFILHRHQHATNA